MKRGPFTGEAFRLKLLTPAFKDPVIDLIEVDFTEAEVPGSSFLDEAFAGLLRAGFLYEEIRRKLKIKTRRSTDEMRIWSYIDEQAQKSAK
ncbi:STAS-like domain-containing protein [Acidovorax sp. NCPPB 2350]|nr:STAS-like domain-containing protein [Acidovorax sp. NCPPB 2350]